MPGFGAPFFELCAIKLKNGTIMLYKYRGNMMSELAFKILNLIENGYTINDPYLVNMFDESYENSPSLGQSQATQTR